MPAIILPETLAQHIAMAVDCSPWDVITALDEIVDQDEYWTSKKWTRGLAKLAPG